MRGTARPPRPRTCVSMTMTRRFLTGVSWSAPVCRDSPESPAWSSSTWFLLPRESCGVAGRRPEEEPMHAETSATPARVVAICNAFEPYGWRVLTAEMVVRRVLGAADRVLVHELIDPSTDVRACELASPEPADCDDDRIEPLVHVLAGFRWRDVTLARLVQILLEALDQWWLRRGEFEHELARLLDEQH